MVVDEVEDFDASSAGEICVCVMSACQHSLGRDASKRMNEVLGRFFGSGCTRPWSRRMRTIVEVDGAYIPCCSRWNWMVSAPESSPEWSSCLRMLMMVFLSFLDTARGLECGAFDFGFTACGPPVS